MYDKKKNDYEQREITWVKLLSLFFYKAHFTV